MKPTLLLAALGAAALVAGCSSTTTTTGGGTTPPAADPTHAEMASDLADLVATYGALSGRTDVPTTGSATYTGFVGGDLSDGRDLVGELELVADFGAANPLVDGITGTATNLKDDLEADFVGSLTGTGAIVFGGTNATPDTLNVTLSGSLENGGVTYDDSSINLSGNFVGGTGAENPDAVIGTAAGFIDETGGASLTLLNGEFAAER